MVKTLPIASLIVNPRNPRRHSADQVARLAASLSDRGQLMPVMARAANHMLIVGHGVCEAARQLGWTEIRVLLWDVDQATADRYMLADNRLSDLSTHDAERVAELLREIAPDDWLGVGFTPAEAERLFGRMDDDALEIREVATDAVRDDFWVSVTGPLKMQALVLDRIRVLMQDFPDVSVDLGIVQRGETAL